MQEHLIKYHLFDVNVVNFNNRKPKKSVKEKPSTAGRNPGVSTPPPSPPRGYECETEAMPIESTIDKDSICIATVFKITDKIHKNPPKDEEQWRKIMPEDSDSD